MQELKDKYNLLKVLLTHKKTEAENVSDKHIHVNRKIIEFDGAHVYKESFMAMPKVDIS